MLPKSTRRWLIASGIVAATALFSSPAAATLKFCNKTSVTRSLAIAQRIDKIWTSEGWWILKPGECKIVVSGDLKQRYFYYRATARGRVYSGDKYYFCTTPKPFTIKGQDGCKKRGYSRAEFRKLDTGKAAKKFTLTFARKPAVPKSAAAGTYGEPITITGSFAGCTTGKDPDYCEISTDEWVYIVPRDNRTPMQLYNKLKALQAGQQVTIEGDILGYGDVTADITARAITPGPAPTEADRSHAKLRGAWKSLSDTKSQIRFDNGQYYSYYDGKLMEQGNYAFTRSCGGINAPTLRVLIDGESEPYCYGIERADKRRLDLMYLPRGNILEYRRAGR